MGIETITKGSMVICNNTNLFEKIRDHILDETAYKICGFLSSTFSHAFFCCKNNFSVGIFCVLLSEIHYCYRVETRGCPEALP